MFHRRSIVMPAASRPRLFSIHSVVAVVIIVAGAVVAVLSYRAGRQDEADRAEAEFNHRAAVRHALAREILGRYEDSLFGLSALFMLDGNVTRTEFQRATTRLEDRIRGAQAFEWVPFVSQENRAAMEAAAQRTYARRGFEFHHFDATGQPVRAPEQPFYYPVLYLQPLRGNEPALGYDLTSAPTRPYLEHARESREVVVSGQFRLVQEKEDKLGVVMIWPVYRALRAATSTPLAPGSATAAASPAPAPTPTPEVFLGFLQCVFRVHDLLETVCAPQAETVLDMMFIDRNEPDPARRVLYYRPSAPATRAGAPTEAEFRRGSHREALVAFGQRDWRVLYRPAAHWLAGQRSSTPFLRSCSFLLLSTLLAGLVQLIGRQTETIRRQVEERTAELAESRRQFSTLLHALPGMAFRCTYDDTLTILFVSEGARDLTGWPAEQLSNGTVHFRDVIHPDDLARVREATRTALEGRNDVEIEYRIRTRDGAEKWVLSRGRGVYAADGKLTIFEGLAIDVTAQKQAEIERLALERKMLEGQKLESLGLLAGGIAHDFNNLLSSILGNANMTRLALPPGTPADAQLRAIETASLRAAELCRQMLAYAGKGRFIVEPTDLTALTEDLLPLLRISIARHATLDLRLDRDLPAVLADATQLRQIVMNLVLNAGDAIGDRGGEITLKTGRTRVTAEELAACVSGAGLPAGDYVFLEVRDTGCGMTAEVMAKIFDPFFTTKFAGRGLGLAAVLGIVRGHRGALHVASTPGVGSLFRLLLPPAPGATVPTKPAEPATSGRWKHAGHLLVIEDEENVRSIAVEILKTFGLTVTDAANGTEGVAVFRSNPARFDLILLDMLMPGLNGEQTLAALRAIKPEVRVLLMSGYSEGDVIRRLNGAGPLGFIAKPFTRDALERKLRELLS
jgi:two-component system cell cycle sensor histidine kinase/response regulator CckA